MLVSDIAASAAKSDSSAKAASGGGAASVDFQNFLKLLTTQMRFQDPTAPLDATQFVSQLASFSSVEQLVSVNQRLDNLAAAFAGGELEKYAGWIGLNAQIADGIVDFSRAPIPIFVEQDPGAASAQLVVRDAAGVEIGRQPVSNADGSFDWDGSVGGAAVKPGRYVLSVDYFDADGLFAGAREVIVSSKITDVRLTPDGAVFGLAGGRRAPFSDIVGVGN